ncbi:MAG TPA: hypothetical protein VGW38_27255, partial [Chloroflexota bacterium]|nr:hypothetical protein [Chloroflexota bacterium]
FTCADNVGVASCSGPTTVTAEGSTTVSGTACDVAGNCASTSRTVKIDKTAPTGSASATPNRVWSPNHKLVDVSTTVSVADASGSGPAGFTLVSVTSNEPDNSLGDGDTPSDIQGWLPGTADVSGQVRAERAGTGSGRIYTITYQISDVAGNTATVSTTVTVPFSQR